MGLFISVAYLTLLERKLLGLIGLRLGPFKVSFLGLLQPIADALKLFSKQEFVFKMPFFYFYILIGVFFIFISCSSFFCIDMLYLGNFSSFIDLFVLMIFLTFNSLIILSIGWLTYSIYSIMGSLRAVVQVLSYEFVLILVILVYVSYYGTFEFIHQNYKFYMFFLVPSCFFFWILGIIVEMGRTPFDFVEGERELVRGFNTDYGSRNFGIIFISEYINIILFRTLTISIFFSSDSLFVLFFILFWIVWFRSVLPRSRIDSLLVLVWKFIIPVLTIFLFFCIIMVWF